MKTDKALLSYKNLTFVEHIIAAVKPLSSSITLVSSKKEHQKSAYTIIKDIKLNKGPVSAVLAALKHTTAELNLIACCDTPLLQTSFIEWLVENHNTKYQATIGYLNNKKMPLTALYHKNCETIFCDHLKNNQLKMMTVLKDLTVNFIEIPKEFHTQLTNVNTQAQLQMIST